MHNRRQLLTGGLGLLMSTWLARSARAVRIVVELLGDRAGAGVDHEAHAAEVIADEEVGRRAADHRVGRGVAARIDEAGDHRAGLVELGRDPERVRVEPAVRDRAVAPPHDAPAEAVDLVAHRARAAARR